MPREDTWRCPPEGWLCLGLMSGTSVDGLDAALVRVHAKYKAGLASSPQAFSWNIQLEHATTLAYPEPLRCDLWRAMELSAVDLLRLDKRWASWSAEAARTWLQGLGVPMSTLSVAGSHGHTVHHRPEEGWTHQLGCGATLHQVWNIPVVSDLRRLDVAWAGQGAPLVPLADQVLFPDWDAVLNLGGFANVSMDAPDGRRLAWDIGPANLLLNTLVHPLPMDRDGQLAAQGEVLPDLLRAWQALEHHHQPPPKSLGREWLEGTVFPVLKDHKDASQSDLLATAVMYIAWSVVKDMPESARVLVTGGGAWNPTLMAALGRLGKEKNLAWEVPQPELVEGKEAMVFAWLGLLRWLGIDNTLSSVTGAQCDSSGGALWGQGAL